MSEAQKTDVTAERLRQYVEKYERLQEEVDGLKDDQKDVLADAKAQGFDKKTIRQVIKLRKQDREKRREEQELLETYKAALGME